ncbi:MAG: hypothetical protein IKE18_09100 [Oscillospiraceae bacterium]|nr:hypothetical protein [Oscillospiraceae bacterium]MBR2806916.1 hypothetical protein [Oscillospiraceae bacterium]
MKEYKMLEVKKSDAEMVMNWMAEQGWEVTATSYWTSWSQMLLITFEKEREQGDVPPAYR